jgi:phosphatidylserine decarboxylase
MKPSLRSAGILLQHLLPHHLISRCVLRLTRVRWRPLKNLVTRLFVLGFQPELSDAIEPDPLAYPDFNAFFTRALRPDARPLAGTAGTLVSPVDGRVSQMGSIQMEALLQAKGRTYTLDALLAGAAPEWAPQFRDGSFATIYLAPHNYHRIHMPTDGTLREIWYVPGRLFNVSINAAAVVHNLFARNERLVLLFEGPVGAFAVIFVGALNVGSMATVWHGDVTPRRPRRCCALPLPPEGERFRARGAEIGRFNMGSTVILLFARDRATLEAGLTSGSVLKMGEQIGRINPPGSQA